MKLLLVMTMLALPAAAGAQTIQMPVQLLNGTRLDIAARGEVKRVPDVAVITAGVVTQARDARAALADNARRMARVLAALRAAGVQERDVATSQIALNPQYRYVENAAPQIIGYQASNGVTVRFREIARSGAILDALVAEGANQIGGPSLVIDKPETAQDEARAAAMATARARAELYARAAGLSVKRIVSISESGDYGGGQPVPVMMAMRASDASPKTEIAPGEQAVGVTVNVTFELN